MLPLMTDEEIVAYARGVVTSEYMLADIRDPDWMTSMLLMLSAWEDQPENLSVYFLVPFAKHAHGMWLNGRVPGCTTSAVCIPMESLQALLDQIQTFWRALNPDVAPVPQSGP